MKNSEGYLEKHRLVSVRADYILGERCISFEITQHKYVECFSLRQNPACKTHAF